MSRSAPSATVLDSTLFANVTFEAGESHLQLGFCNGGHLSLLRFPRVPLPQASAAHSKGSFFNRQFETISTTRVSGGPNEMLHEWILQKSSQKTKWHRALAWL